MASLIHLLIFSTTYHSACSLLHFVFPPLSASYRVDVSVFSVTACPSWSVWTEGKINKINKTIFIPGDRIYWTFINTANEWMTFIICTACTTNPVWIGLWVSEWVNEWINTTYFERKYLGKSHKREICRFSIWFYSVYFEVCSKMNLWINVLFKQHSIKVKLLTKINIFLFCCCCCL